MANNKQLAQGIVGKYIIDVHKSGGGLFGYKYVDQEFHGLQMTANGVENYWVLTCKNPGFNLCRGRNLHFVKPGTDFTELDQIAIGHCERILNDFLENDEKDETKNSENYKVKITYNNNEYYLIVHLRKSNKNEEIKLSSKLIKI
jgi:hypothetical protein